MMNVSDELATRRRKTLQPSRTADAILDHLSAHESTRCRREFKSLVSVVVPLIRSRVAEAYDEDVSLKSVRSIT